MTETKNGIFQDANGNRSSKRIIGTALVSSGGLFLLSLGIASIFRAIGDPSTALETGKVLLYAGTALLGVGVVEGFKK